MTHSKGGTTPSKGRYEDFCGCTIFYEGVIILLRDVSTTEGGMTAPYHLRRRLMPSDGGIKAVDGDNIFPEGGIMTLEGAGGIVNSESDRSQDNFGGRHFTF